MHPTKLRLRDSSGHQIAQCALYAGRARGYHFGCFALLGACAAGQWLGSEAVLLVLLGFYARWQSFVPASQLRVRSGQGVWLCPWLLVVPAGWLRYHSYYSDELPRRDYVRLRRLLLRAARQARKEPLDLPAFELV